MRAEGGLSLRPLWSDTCEPEQLVAPNATCNMWLDIEAGAVIISLYAIPLDRQFSSAPILRVQMASMLASLRTGEAEQTLSPPCPLAPICSAASHGGLVCVMEGHVRRQRYCDWSPFEASKRHVGCLRLCLEGRACVKTQIRV